MTGLELTPILVALIAAGLFKSVVDAIKWLIRRRKDRTEAATPEARQSRSVQTAEESLAVVARARDELEADNATLRGMLAEERAAATSRESDLIRRHAADRIDWATEKAGLRAEVDDLQARLKAILAEVEELKRRRFPS